MYTSIMDHAFEGLGIIFITRLLLVVVGVWIFFLCFSVVRTNMDGLAENFNIPLLLSTIFWALCLAVCMTLLASEVPGVWSPENDAIRAECKQIHYLRNYFKDEYVAQYNDICLKYFKADE